MNNFVKSSLCFQIPYRDYWKKNSPASNSDFPLNYSDIKLDFYKKNSPKFRGIKKTSKIFFRDSSRCSLDIYFLFVLAKSSASFPLLSSINSSSFPSEISPKVFTSISLNLVRGNLLNSHGGFFWKIHHGFFQKYLQGFFKNLPGKHNEIFKIFLWNLQ